MGWSIFMAAGEERRREDPRAAPGSRRPSAAGGPALHVDDRAGGGIARDQIPRIDVLPVLCRDRHELAGSTLIASASV
jgi:hypothetical protein